MKIPVVLPNCLSADGAAIRGDEVLAVNGHDSAIYNVSGRCEIQTAKPYFFISFIPYDGGLLALSERCGNRIYVLNGELQETASVVPNVYAGALESAFVYPDASGILLTYGKLAAKVDASGRLLETVGFADDADVDLLSSYPLTDGFILAYTDGDRTIIRLIADGESSFILPECVSFKSFAEDGDGTVYALVGKGYPYTYLTPVYENGVLIPITPQDEVFGGGV